MATTSTRNAPTRTTGRMLPDPIGSSLPGLPGWDVLAAQAQQIDVPELRWPQSIRTFEAMRRDSQVQGLLTSVFLPIRHMDWFVDPAGTTGSVAEEIAEDLGLPLLGDPPVADGVGIDFDDHLRLALLALAMGNQIFEETGEIQGAGAAMRYRLRSLMQYPPPTIMRINVTPTGDLRSVQQNTVAEFPEVPADRLLAYVWDREGANWAGRPLLVGIYKNWLAKDALVRSDVVVHRRFSGIPVAETTDQSVGKDAREDGARMAQLLQSGDGAGLATPYGMRLRLLGVEGTLPDAIASIRYHDEQMARAFMQMFAELGKTQSGSRALGTTLMDHYALGVLAVAKWARKSLMVLVRRIADRNYGPDSTVPKIGFRQDDHEDITVQDLVAAIDAGLIVVDDELEQTIRERANLPAKDPTTSRQPPSPPGPTAGSRRRPTRPSAASAAEGIKVPDRPMRRDPLEFETRAAVDFAALEMALEDGVDALVREWQDVRGAQVDELAALIESADGDLEALAAIQATSAGHDALLARMLAVAADGMAGAMEEAIEQGATLTAPGDDALRAILEPRANATADLLSRALSEAAGRRALALTGGALAPTEVAGEVRGYIEDLTDTYLRDQFNGVLVAAENTGRRETMRTATGVIQVVYASALLDLNTCAPCLEWDGHEFDSLDQAEAQFPTGGNQSCLGGPRCRCTLVATYDEAPTT